MMALAARPPLAFEVLEGARRQDVPAHNLTATETVTINGRAPETYTILWQHGEKIRRVGDSWRRIEDERAEANARFAFGKWAGLDGGFKLRGLKTDRGLWLVQAEGHLGEWMRQRRRYWIEPENGRLRRFECQIVRDGGEARKGSEFRFEFGEKGLVSYWAKFALGQGRWTTVQGAITNYKTFSTDSKILVQ
ncbi:MAG: hypothetical protein FJW30_14890 [Acidobacteria bacterium]|nr:hypothetical protein [Acidobacteriota bacterium]